MADNFGRLGKASAQTNAAVTLVSTNASETALINRARIFATAGIGTVSIVSGGGSANDVVGTYPLAAGESILIKGAILGNSDLLGFIVSAGLTVNAFAYGDRRS